MIASYLRKPEGALVTPVSEAEMRATIGSGEGLLWVDIQTTERASATLLSEVFGFHRLAIDDCFNQHVDPAKIDDYGSHIFIIAQAISAKASAERIITTELDLFLGSNYVVSFHQEPLPFIDALHKQVRNDGPLLAHGADFLAHALLDALVDGFQPQVEHLDDTLSRLEELVLTRPESAFLTEILALKRNVQRLRRTIIPQRDMVNRIARGEFPAVVRPESQIYFRDVYDHTVRVEELVESVRDLADGALNTYLGALNNRMNEVMKTLSVVAAIFLPLTLIASIYGMNFEHMPELGWRWGYFGILGAMAAVALSLVVFFRLRRWF